MLTLLTRKTLTGAILAAAAVAAGAASACPNAQRGIGVERVVEIEAAGAPIYGALTRQAREDSFLGPKEVVLTFDDGPMPWITKSILDTLDRFCTKATFFPVGRMAIAYPATLRDVLARGHTVGSHTWSHPKNLALLQSARAVDEIERGIAAVALAAGQPVAPFFRFPGLNDSVSLLAYLQQRGIATFTVDVVSNDSFVADAKALAKLTLERVEHLKGGIILFHDIKAATARALPAILTELKARGYKVVHMKAKEPAAPLAAYEKELGPALAKSVIDDAKKGPLPFFGKTGPTHLGDEPLEPPVSELAPPPRERAPRAKPGDPPQPAASETGPPPATNPWSTRVKRIGDRPS